MRMLLLLLALLLPSPAKAALTPSVSDASGFPATPEFRTFNPITNPTNGNFTVHSTRNLTQTFRLASPLKLGMIHLLYIQGQTGVNVHVRIFRVANTTATGGTALLNDYNTAVSTNGFLYDSVFTMPATPAVGTDLLLTLSLSGVDQITLPATTGTAGYAITFELPGDQADPGVFSWRGHSLSSGTAGPYPEGAVYYPDWGRMANARDFSLAIETDTDGDLMPDSWENAHGTDPQVDDAAVDNDANGGPDNLTNLEEYRNRTDPQDSDSDDDTLADGTEVKALHASGFDSNPALSDSDADGAPDLAEHTGSLNTQFGNAKTDPMVADSDGDGMDDGYELTCNTPGDALNPNDNGSIDATQAPTGHRDSDNLTNIEEYTPTLGPNSASPRTRADLADTDDDGYTDMQEDNLGWWNGVNFTGTNPTDADTDNDGIDDGDENPETGTAGSAPYNSNPTSADTDGDSFSDHYEVHHSADPTNAESTPAQPANFTLVENFEGAGMDIGQTFNGVNGWSTTVPAGAMVADEPIAGGDKAGAIIRVAGSSFGANKSLTAAGLQVLEGKTGTIFLQLYCPTGAQDNSFGLSDEAAPTAFTGYETQLITYSNGNLRLCDTGAVFRDISPYAVQAWMNIWIVADNAADTYRVYVESPQGQTGQVEITANDSGDPFNFRSGTTGALISFLTMVATSASAGSAVLIDNIYIDPTKANLTTPAAAKPLPPLPFQVTNVSFEGGNLKITFSPGGAGYILTSSDDLSSPFALEASATFDGIDTFTVPAASLNPGYDFFRIEESP